MPMSPPSRVSKEPAGNIRPGDVGRVEMRGQLFMFPAEVELTVLGSRPWRPRV